MGLFINYDDLIFVLFYSIHYFLMTWKLIVKNFDSGDFFFKNYLSFYYLFSLSLFSNVKKTSKLFYSSMWTKYHNKTKKLKQFYLFFQGKKLYLWSQKKAKYISLLGDISWYRKPQYDEVVCFLSCLVDLVMQKPYIQIKPKSIEYHVD